MLTLIFQGYCHIIKSNLNYNIDSIYGLKTWQRSHVIIDHSILWKSKIFLVNTNNKAYKLEIGSQQYTFWLIYFWSSTKFLWLRQRFVAIYDFLLDVFAFENERTFRYSHWLFVVQHVFNLGSVDGVPNYLSFAIRSV